MAIDTNQFTQLCEHLADIDLFGKAPPAPPWGNQPSATKVHKAIDGGTHSLPLVYQTGYVDPLVQHLNTVLTRTGGDVEPFAASVYEHAPGSQVLPQLRRFLAVISNFYRSFLSKAKRSAINVPLVEQLPPLAFFKNSGEDGPFTIPADDVQKLFGSTIGVVSLPSTYRDDPLLWASLAHETGGHDVLHADPGLLEELADGLRNLFGGGPLPANGNLTQPQLDGLLWSYWTDEAASDVYGLLNIGPEFAFNLAAFFAAMNARIAKMQHQPETPMPSLRTESGPNAADDPSLDVHPTDILRLHLAIGVVENLQALSSATRARYVADLQNLAVLCAQGTDTVEIQGDVAVTRDQWVTVNMSRPLADMQEAARRAGAFIATAKLQALDNHSVQEIETWDDPDESTAQKIADTLAQNASVADMGDDAQILAGATLALVAQPKLYDKVTRRLEEALDRSFAHDPIWESLVSDPIIAPRRLHRSAATRPRFQVAAEGTEAADGKKKRPKVSKHR
jgi:hypothetical protein